MANVASLLIALAALIFAGVTLRRSNRIEGDKRIREEFQAYVASLENRVKDGEQRYEELKGTSIMQQRELDDCKRARDAFEDKNFQLLQEAYDTRKIVDELRRKVENRE
jgi:hypothetical protein